MHMIRWFLKHKKLIIGIPVFLVFFTISTILFHNAFLSRQMPPLKKWHTTLVTGEFHAAQYQKFQTIEEYLQEERKLIQSFADFSALFFIKVEHSKDLDEGKVSSALQREFAQHNIHFSDKVSIEIKKKNNEWIWADKESRSKYYLIKSPQGIAVFSNHDRTYNRYCSKSASAQIDKNLSFHLNADKANISGGILLIHGLSDSPYMMADLAKTFAKRNLYVLSLRLPGHGTIPAGLLDITWQEWYAAVEFGVRMVQEHIKDKPFYIGGFSTGGALAVSYALKNLDSPKKVNGLFLFAPAIGLKSQMARFADWHKILSWMPYFSQFQWASIEPEYDSCKYNSFAKNAGDQIYLLTKANKALASSVREADKSKVPPLYAFQSTVDATVDAEALISLFENIGNSAGTLYLFDINRSTEVLNFIRPEIIEKKAFALHTKPFPSRLALVTNQDTIDEKVMAFMFPPRSGDYSLSKATAIPLTESWPEQSYALSHICLTIAPDNPVYGQKSPWASVMPRGEKMVFWVSDADLSRIRYNPFFGFMQNQLENIIDAITIE